MTPANPHFERLGGHDAVVRLVEAFYRAMDELPQARAIRAMHEADLGATRLLLTRYLSEWMGGPRLYTPDRGPPRLRRRHMPFAIDDAARDAWMDCMRSALAETCAEPGLRAELEAAFAKVADALRNTAPNLSQRLEHTVTTTLEQTAFARLQSEGRLLNSVLKGATHKPGRVGYRGDLALKFQAKMADEARPPEISAEQVIAVAHEGQPHIAFLAGFLLSFEYLQLLAETLAETLSPQGKYFLFVDNIDISKKYVVDFGGATFYVLPIDESTVYNELLALLYIEKTELKKLDTAGKTDAVADKALAFSASFERISFEEGVKAMGPVRNVYENRPV